MAYEILYTLASESVSTLESDLDTLNTIHTTFNNPKIIAYLDKTAPFLDWLITMLDCLEIPHGDFRTMYVKGLMTDYDEVKNIIDYIENLCESYDEREKETCGQCKETKIDIWYYNTTPVKNLPICSDCHSN
jgi:hypothetical protein